MDAEGTSSITLGLDYNFLCPLVGFREHVLEARSNLWSKCKACTTHFYRNIVFYFLINKANIHQV